MLTNVMRILAVMASIWFAAPAPGATIYVNKSNMAGPWDGTSWGTAWTNLAGAVTDLAAKNAVTPGGHRVWVATGVYYEAVNLGANHSGIGGSPNTFLTNGAVTLDGWVGVPFSYSVRDYIVTFTNANYITIDGFSISNAGQAAVRFASGSNFDIIQNCDISSINYSYPAISVADNASCTVRFCTMRNSSHGIQVGSAANTTVVDQCTMVFNGTGIGGAYGARIYARNCIIAGNALAGISHSLDFGKITGINNCFFGNGNNVASSTRRYNTVAEINALTNGLYYDFSNNIVANPGFADLAKNWNVNKVYTNSPCLKSGWGGADMGRYQNPPQAPVSSKTYYVATNGNDSSATPTNTNTPWLTISKAASVAVAGDTVVVKPGTYAEQVTITNGGAEGLPVTYRADGNVFIRKDLKCFYLDRVSAVVIDGFTCVGAVHAVANAYLIHLYCSLDNTIKNGACYGNQYTWSPALQYYGGIGLDRSPVNTIQSVNIYSNNVGIYNLSGSSRITVDRCSLHHNLSTPAFPYNGSGVAIMSETSDWTVRNCNIYANSNNGIYAARSGRHAIQYCTIVSNNLKGVFLYDNASASMVNSIVQGNGAGVFVATSGSHGYATNNCFWNNVTNLYDGTTVRNTANEINSAAGCTNNIVADALLMDVAGGDFRFTRASPCFNGGMPTPEIRYDYFGNLRPIFGGYDIGSYEIPTPSGTIVSFH